ncbi:acyl-CoA dehydrogenase family protein [Sphingomonas sp. 3-13AW]|uniref:acyl-CoA dehydrogenase family protein n=1 Tax=Sphingomonas sp. 3-13AW TaxID=3050450 RepID=UPI003BB7E791
MNFDLDDEQILVRDAIDRLFDTQAAAETHDLATEWRAYQDLGLIALPFSAEQGGLDGSRETIMLLMESYGRTLAQAPYLQSVLLAGRILARTGHPALGDLLDGGLHAVLCLHEPGMRYRWDIPATQAVRTDAGWTLRGAKVAVLDADSADLILCPATTAEGLAIFLVPAATPGLSVQIHPTPDGRRAANLTFDVMLPHDAAIGDPAMLGEAVDGGIVACCAEAVGAMERLVSLSADYLNTRHQFGVPLSCFQALQHRAADMLVAVEQARSMTFYAVSMLDAPPAQRQVAVAASKALVNRAARFVGSEAIQLHGGMGLAAEYPAGRYFQRLTVLETMLGDTDHLLEQVEAGPPLPS